MYRGMWRTQEVAIKMLKNQASGIIETDRIEFSNEVDLMTKLRSPYIVSFIGVCRFPGRHCIVTEYFPVGSLRKILKEGVELSKRIKLKIALDTAQGLNFLHESK